ncbi:Uncharacterised protein [uncultured Blautia sp.]|nr:Uncharacterised protein [uncultured Blautia sp.]
MVKLPVVQVDNTQGAAGRIRRCHGGHDHCRQGRIVGHRFGRVQNLAAADAHDYGTLLLAGHSCQPINLRLTAFALEYFVVQLIVLALEAGIQCRADALCAGLADQD